MGKMGEGLDSEVQDKRGREEKTPKPMALAFEVTVRVLQRVSKLLNCPEANAF